MTIRSVLVALSLFFILMPGALQASAPAAPQRKVSVPIAIASRQPQDTRHFHGEVIATTNASITVRDRYNERLIRTFTCSPNLAAKMQDIVARGNNQPNDKVEVSCHAGNNEAYSIKSKPSVPR